MSNKFESQLNELEENLIMYRNSSFINIMNEWNKVMNLTGITEYDEVNEKHFVDSLAIVKAV